jgi:uncharacterized protein (TIGR03118 family)
MKARRKILTAGAECSSGATAATGIGEGAEATLPSRTQPIPSFQRGRSVVSLLRDAKNLLAAVLVAVVAAGLGAAGAAAKANSYTVTKLVSNVFGFAANQDPLLVNPWGLAAQGSTPWWVVDNQASVQAGVATLYQADGSSVPLTVQLTGAGLSGPTGIVANPDPTFVLPNGGPAAFLFATLGGGILGWNPAVPFNSALVLATTSGAVYTGLAIGSTSGSDFLYAADPADGRVDVFDQFFRPVSTSGGFSDPALPAGFSPFGIQNVDGTIAVTFAKPGAGGPLAGPGLGVVDLFDASGNLLGRVGSGGQLNAPWGVAKAPAQGFGRFSGDLLIGNHGDGRIIAFQSKDGKFKSVGQLALADGTPVTIDGLWALQFGKGATSNGPATTLFFTAGPQSGQQGLFGSITAG